MTSTSYSPSVPWTLYQTYLLMKRGGCHTNTLTGSKYETFMAIYKTYAIQSSAKRKMSMQKDPEIRDVVSCMKLLSSFTNLYDLCKRQKKSIWFWNDDRIFILGWTVSLRKAWKYLWTISFYKCNMTFEPSVCPKLFSLDLASFVLVVCPGCSSCNVEDLWFMMFLVSVSIHITFA